MFNASKIIYILNFLFVRICVASANIGKKCFFMKKHASAHLAYTQTSECRNNLSITNLRCVCQLQNNRFQTFRVKLLLFTISQHKTNVFYCFLWFSSLARYVESYINRSSLVQLYRKITCNKIKIKNKTYWLICGNIR